MQLNFVRDDDLEGDANGVDYNNNELGNSYKKYINDDDEMKSEVDREDSSDLDSQNDDDKSDNDDENKDRDEGDYYYFNEDERKENLSGVKNFNIYSEIQAALIKDNTTLPEDDNEPLYKKEDVITSETTKGNFARRVHAFCKTYRLTAIAEHDLLIVINESFPHANLPIKISDDKDDKDNYKSTVSKYVEGQSLVEELKSLYNGQEFIVNGISYFIQAIHILHLIDTKAFEHTFKI